MNIRPNRSVILKEAALRSLNQGELAPGQPFKPSQEQGLRNLYDFLQNTSDDFERRHGYFDMATSTGKTGMFSLIGRHAHRIAQEKGIGDSFKTLIVEPTVPLLRQTRKELLRIAPEMASAVGIFGGGSKELDKPTTIISYEAWVSLLENNELQGSMIDLNINDESHKGLSVRRQKLINDILVDAHHLGFTASAKYDAEKTMELTHRNKIYEIGLREAIEGGMLADYVHVQYAIMRLLPTDLNQPGLELSNADFTFLKRREWSRLINRAYSGMIDGISGEPLSDKVAIFFAADTRHADSLADMLNKNPILQQKAKDGGFKNVAASIHSVGHNYTTQDRLQAEFESGDYMVAVGDKKFQAGFDYPRVKMIASYPGTSPVDTVQEMGRATRPYADPRTGEDQGAVIFEAIPYIGDADPQKNQKAKDAALKNIVTARDILGGTLALKPGRKHGKPSGGGGGGLPVILSPGCTVEVFLTEEETLTISRQVDEARKSKDKAPLTVLQIVEWVKSTTERTGKVPAGSSDDVPVWEELSDGAFQIVAEEKWDGIDNALRHKGRGLFNDPNFTNDIGGLADLKRKYGLIEHHYISITTQMYADLKAKLYERGDLGSRRLMQQIKAYELEKNLQETGLTEHTLWNYLSGGALSVRETYWKRINEVITALPIMTGHDRIDITPDVLENLKRKMLERGALGSARLIKEIAKYETKNKKTTNAGLTRELFQNVLNGNVVTMNKAYFDRILEVLDNIPLLDIGEKIVLTDEKLTEILQKISKLENYGAIRLMQTVDLYESQTGKPSSGLTGPKIQKILSGKVGAIGKNQIDRLVDAVEFAILAGVSTRVDLTTAVLKEFEEKLKKLGYGSRQLMSEIKKYELANKKESTNITQGKIQTILSHNVKSFDKIEWKRLNEVIDNLLKSETEKVVANPGKSKSSSRTMHEADVVEVARLAFAEMFSKQSSDLVEQIAREVAKKLGVQAARTVGAIENVVVPGQSLDTETASSELAFEQKTPSIEPIPSHAPAAENFEIAPITVADVTAIVKEQKELPQGMNFATFASPFFQQKDAAGDTMLSCLQNAQRDFAFENNVGLRANLRKFSELFIHNTLMATTETYLEKFQLPEERRKQAIHIIRSYQHSCAQVELGEPEGHGKFKRYPRIEMGELTRSIKDLIGILSVAEPERFPPGIMTRVREIMAAGGKIHLQIGSRDTINEAQLLQNGFELANWFNLRFAPKPIPASTVAPTIIENKAEPNPDSTTKPVTAAPIVEAASEVTSPPPSMLPSILRAFDLTNEQFVEMANIRNMKSLMAIAAFAQEWAMEDVATKRERNRVVQGLYPQVQAQVEMLAATGKNIQEIADELNQTNRSRDLLTGGELVWTPEYFLRGAVLNNGKLPLQSYLSDSARSITVRRNSDLGKPKP